MISFFLETYFFRMRGEKQTQENQGWSWNSWMGGGKKEDNPANKPQNDMGMFLFYFIFSCVHVNSFFRSFTIT